MGALEIPPLGAVAVVAQHLKAGRVVHSLEPAVEKDSTADLFSVLATATVDVVNRQELPLSLAAALANSPIGFNRCQPKGMVVVPVLRIDLVLVLGVVVPLLCLLPSQVICISLAGIDLVAIALLVRSALRDYLGMAVGIVPCSLAGAIRRAKPSVAAVGEKLIGAFGAGIRSSRNLPVIAFLGATESITALGRELFKATRANLLIHTIIISHRLFNNTHRRAALLIR